jgi:hypothetical protein
MPLFRLCGAAGCGQLVANASRCARHTRRPGYNPLFSAPAGRPAFPKHEGGSWLYEARLVRDGHELSLPPRS